MKVKQPRPLGPEWYWLVVSIWLVIVGIMAGFLVEPIKADIVQIVGINWFYLYLFVIIPAYVALSYKEQTSDQWGIKLLFGSRPLQVTNNGPANVMWPIFGFTTLPKTTIQNQYPAEDKDIDWERNANEPSAPNKVAPIRATTGVDDEEATEKDPLKHRLTLNLSDTVTFRINDPIQFLIVLGGGNDGEAGLVNARKQIEDVAVGAMVAAIGKKTASWVIENIKVLNRSLKQSTQKLVGEISTGAVDQNNAWGVEVVNAQIVRFDLPTQVNLALRNVPKAEFEKQATITTAEGEEERLIHVGQGKASARQAEEKAALVGMADGVRYAINQNLGLTGAQISALQAVDEIARSQNKTIVLGEGVITGLPGQIAKAIGQIGT
jgi:regulator of protease activity HflC (stomatin/prohibitin superfamily)